MIVVKEPARSWMARGMPAIGAALVIGVTFGTLAIAAFSYSAHRDLQAGGGVAVPVAVYFNPGDKTTDAVVEHLRKARRRVRVQAYYFTSPPIAHALVEARRRGVDVQAILDPANKSSSYSSPDFLVQGGVPTFIDRKHSIAHNKIMIIDDDTILTGSFNFTKNAEERNAENLVVLRDRRLAQKYDANFRRHLEHSEPYTGRGS